jgi:hypothetical protein
MSGAIPPLHTPSCRGAQLKHRDNFTFNIILASTPRSRHWSLYLQVFGS